MYYTNVYIVLFISVCVSDNVSHYCSFYTVKKIEICATQKDEWVRKTLELLSSKLKKMSKADSVAGETKMRKSVTSSFTDGSGSFLHTTDTSPNSTQSFY